TLERSTLIAEAWDAGGLYQVGSFPGERWCEWNGRFRDDVRAFLRGDSGMAGAMAHRMLGSPDLYERLGRQPTQCVNFVTAHDGFTLADLVSHERKHNHANGEDDRDGHDHEQSHNHGVEGPTDDPEIRAVRARQQRNFLVALFLAQGTPMLLAGDEVGRTQGGNNNAWCQDNPVSWMDWSLLERNADLLRFTRLLIEFRKAHPSLCRSRYLLGLDAPSGHDFPGYTRVRWHGVEPDSPDWSFGNRVLAYALTPSMDDVGIYVAFNAHTDTVEMTLPPPMRGQRWLRVIDTGRVSPRDIAEPRAAPAMDGEAYALEGRSALVCIEDDAAPLLDGTATQSMLVPEELRRRPV
ncbi:MAG: glycogen debranching enzyme, partial [Myxococcales bacterium]|nr:glycogen debranching enzyme [Myxococcales bacterium]